MKIAIQGFLELMRTGPSEWVSILFSPEEARDYTYFIGAIDVATIREFQAFGGAVRYLLIHKGATAANYTYTLQASELALIAKLTGEE